MRSLIALFSLFLGVHSYAASIWHVDGEQEFYLFGTIHVLKPDSYPLPPVYASTLKKCDALWLEADSDELKDANILHELQQMMRLPVGDKLQDQLSENAYQQLQILAEKAGVSLSLLQGLKPWAAANQLTLVIFQQKGFTGEGLDMYLQRFAQQQNIPVHAFETLLWQLNMFDELSDAYGDEFVEFSTADMDDVDQLVQDLYRNWRSGDVATMYEQAAFDGYERVEQRMLVERNNAWMKTLLGSNHNGVQCVAVGALHMAADHGLLNQFKEAGYRVTQLRD
ncbi:MAG: TraB/GumN family protein [Reinekea sp.]|nr:TraB/GumN family protein [Reinekea sp.]